MKRPVKYIRRTPAELKVFKSVVDYYMTMGYPRDFAEQYAWDTIFNDRKARKLMKQNKVEVF